MLLNIFQRCWTNGCSIKRSYGRPQVKVMEWTIWQKYAIAKKVRKYYLCNIKVALKVMLSWMSYYVFCTSITDITPTLVNIINSDITFKLKALAWIIMFVKNLVHEKHICDHYKIYICDYCKVNCTMIKTAC